MVADNADASTGFAVEKREDMKERFDHVLGHGLDREIEVRRKKPYAAPIQAGAEG